jgi:uncharacterized membrane protein YesL
MTFWVLYDFLGPLVVLNVLTLAAVLLPAWVLAVALPEWTWLPIVVAALMASVIAVAETHLIATLLSDEAFSYALVWRGIRTCGIPALLLLAVYTAIGAVVAVGFWFYTTRVAPARPLAGTTLAMLCLSTGGTLALSAVHSLPALVHQRGSVAGALRVSFWLAARHPVLTLGLLLAAMAYGVVLVTPPGLVLLSGLPVIALTCSAYELLARAYASDAALALGDAAAEVTPDEDDPFLNRGFSDLLHPWKV